MIVLTKTDTSFNPADQNIYHCKQCRSRVDGSLRAVSSWSTLVCFRSSEHSVLFVLFLCVFFVFFVCFLLALFFFFFSGWIMNTPEPWTVDYQCEFYSANKVSIEFVSVSQYIMNIHLPRLILLKYLRRKLSRINKLSGRINNIEDFQEETHSQTIAYKWHQKEEQIYHCRPLRKHAYSNILKSLPPKKWKFSDKNLIYFSYFCS